MNTTQTHNKGFTLIEVVVTIVIAAILATVAFRGAMQLSDTAKVEETKQELEQLEFAIVGNPLLYNDDTRSDFGYVGDVGAFPGNLDALNSNPGGYATWNGPYIKRRFEQDATAYKKDAWGNNYSYSGGPNLTSTGSGSNIVREFGAGTADFLINGVDGVVLDVQGTPPGTTYKDSITVRLTIPNGSGNYLTKTAIPDKGGYFSYDSIPIGNHDLEVIYKPNDDTLKRFVSVLPKSRHYGEYYLANSGWTSVSSGALVYVDGTAETTGGACKQFRFDVTNSSGSDVTITSMTNTWSSPTSYYKKIKFDGVDVVDEDPRIGSGQQANFNSGQTVNSGDTITIEIKDFKDSASGGDDVDMSNVDVTITFSDGSTITFNTGTCTG